MRTLSCMLVALGLAGCSLHARTPDDYRKVTRELVDSQSGDFRDCYAQAIEANAEAGGDVAVSFQVEAKTGKLHSPSLVPERTTAGEQLGQCVVNTLEGLSLEAPDRRTAEAEFVWSFERS